MNAVDTTAFRILDTTVMGPEERGDALDDLEQHAFQERLLVRQIRPGVYQASPGEAFRRIKPVVTAEAVAQRLKTWPHPTPKKKAVRRG